MKQFDKSAASLFCHVPVFQILFGLTDKFIFCISDFEWVLGFRQWCHIGHVADDFPNLVHFLQLEMCRFIHESKENWMSNSPYHWIALQFSRSVPPNLVSIHQQWPTCCIRTLHMHKPSLDCSNWTFRGRQFHSILFALAPYECPSNSVMVQSAHSSAWFSLASNRWECDPISDSVLICRNFCVLLRWLTKLPFPFHCVESLGHLCRRSVQAAQMSFVHSTILISVRFSAVRFLLNQAKCDYFQGKQIKYSIRMGFDGICEI